MFQECRHVKTNGLKCKSPALRGMAYCYFHARLHRASNGPNPLKIPVVETAKDIQTALVRVINDLKYSRPNSRNTELCLWALQIAAQVANRDHPAGKPMPRQPQTPPGHIAS